ncbi:hypothetical protein L9F63_025572 [Diploptera punctata]|uniref:Secreted protein n=1 Tax=Diploptera punctata TaxID=6984 RepID=A0AAD7Z9R0_DIPPU|nr:hypothetical protein L9F63_025572 [Diploptera punctata]
MFSKKRHSDRALEVSLLFQLVTSSRLLLCQVVCPFQHSSVKINIRSTALEDEFQQVLPRTMHSNCLPS